MSIKQLIGFFSLIICFQLTVFAQDANEEHDLDVIEAEIKKTEIAPVIKERAVVNKEAKEVNVSDEKVETLSDLSKLQSFSETSTLQKRYMPKTGRFSVYGGLSLTVNDPWNNSYGGGLRFGYGITEAWTVEFAQFFMSTTSNDTAQRLFSNHSVSAETFGIMQRFSGLYAKWTPIYGKMSLFRKKIIPFDMYFSLGGGNTSLTGQNVNPNAAGPSFAVGQLYSIDRSFGFRWDVTWNNYTIVSTPASGASTSNNINNIILTLGLAWHFPEANYR